jgi:hypothetical protein
MSRFVRVAVVCVALACGLVVLVNLGACATRVLVRMVPPPYGDPVAIAPPETGPGGSTLRGYVIGGSSDSYGDGTTNTLYRTDVAWGTPRQYKLSQLLITDSTVVQHGGIPVVARSRDDKWNAIMDLTRNVWGYHDVAVSYESTTANIGISNLPGTGYFLSPIVRIDIDPRK